jgi:DNA helicase-2/ATP-dependent DNA helicase PcrA
VAAAELLHDLDESQRRAVTSRARPLAILAPAGSGKTRVLTRRIAYQVATEEADASHVLALTFTRKAAGELRDRLRALGLREGVAAGTFHGVAWAQLRARWSDEGRAAPTLLTRKGRLLGDLLTGPGGGRGGMTVAQLAGEIEWAKARLVGPAGYVEAVASAKRRPPAPAERVADLYARYEEEKQRRRFVDFDDLLRLCSHLLETDPSFAATQRWRFRHLYVDEFQDVNPLQMQLLEAWRGGRWDLCVVGDPHQAIYGWNGADAGFLEGFSRHYPPAEVVTLDRNYRSTPQVLAAAADVLVAARVPDRVVRPVRADGTPPRLDRHPSDRDEAHAVARAVRDARAPGTAWKAQAVLARTHAQLPLLAEALRLAGVPHRVRGEGELLARPEVRSAVALLRRADGLLAAALPDLRALAAEAESSEGLEAEATANLDLVVRCAHDHLRLDSSASTRGFLAWLVATLESEGGDGSGDAVTLGTFHAAKGLEWPVVHLTGLEDGFVPIAHARTRHDRTEEARLLYVAMTRAEDVLRCTWAAQRDFGGKAVERRLSPWLAALADAQRARPEAGRPSEDWRRHLAAQRAELAAASAAARAPMTGALAVLHAWREDAARAARVEPQTLVDDHLLEAIAAELPTSREELAGIPGMGRLLAARVGDSLLAALAGAG